MFFIVILTVLAIVFKEELKNFIKNCISFFEKGVENPKLKNCQISPMIVETIKRDETTGNDCYGTELAITFNDGKKIMVFGLCALDVNAWRSLKKGDVCSRIVKYSKDNQIVEEFYLPKAPDEVRYCKDFKNSCYVS